MEELEDYRILYVWAGSKLQVCIIPGIALSSPCITFIYSESSELRIDMK